LQVAITSLYGQLRILPTPAQLSARMTAGSTRELNSARSLIFASCACAVRLGTKTSRQISRAESGMAMNAFIESKLSQQPQHSGVDGLKVDHQAPPAAVAMPRSIP
jgi:hypothetical protein